MGRGKKYQTKQVVNLLDQIELAVANGKQAREIQAGLSYARVAKPTSGREGLFKRESRPLLKRLLCEPSPATGSHIQNGAIGVATWTQPCVTLR
jgi:hypothetical protein